jgi:hypothetical protein
LKNFFFIIPLQNDDLKKLVKKILDGANLEQVTMKTVVKQVSKLFDNTDRKKKFFNQISSVEKCMDFP